MWVAAARGLYDGGRDGRAIDFDTRSVGEGWRLGRSELHEIFICRPKFRLSDLTPADNEVMISPDLLISAENDPSVPQPIFTITEKAPTRAFSWLKAPTSAFTRHY